MIDLYFWPTPNGQKVSIFLEEAGLPYNVIPINIGKGEQFERKFLEISPNNKIPAMVDHEGPGGKPISVFESGAMLMYLAEKARKFMPTDPRGRWQVVEWVMFQMGTVGPMLGQANHFRNYAPEKLQYAIDRYTNESKRIFNVMDSRLSKHEYLAGEYSIADMASWPWIVTRKKGGEYDEFANLKRWADAIGERPAVKRGMAVLTDVIQRGGAGMDAKAKEILFGPKQYERR
ncbi:MAG TPA: glutathione S-transferase N-terminal domain-containing protein [Candidatus Binataceae bacterium]|jgi:GST-like protein|nr:glutathione S-transferase N-terminal domain-containing protein [Candidatus Binataceae bacterium]